MRCTRPGDRRGSVPVVSEGRRVVLVAVVGVVLILRVIVVFCCCAKLLSDYDAFGVNLLGKAR